MHALPARVARDSIHPTQYSLNKPLSMPRKVKDSLQWWTCLHNVCAGVPFLQIPLEMISTTDTSLLDWGAHLNNLSVQGRWSISESTLHINILELRAVRNACAHFLPLIENKTIQIMTDNVASLFHINKERRGHSLCTVAMKLWKRCIQQITVSADYPLGSQNIMTDILSRKFSHDHE